MGYKIGIIDYGMGNLRSVQKALEHLGARAEIIGAPMELKACAGVVLPGVGAFAQAMDRLEETGLGAAFLRAAKEGKAVLGVCLGMQLMMAGSEEFGFRRGLGLFDGDITRFDSQNGGLKIPHMGWNSVEDRACPILKGLDGREFYFVHSYRAARTEADWVGGVTRYGGEFCSVAWRGNAFATQFHPEKSGESGLMLYKNWLEVVSC